MRTNTIFGVVHAADGYTAWSDKHPAYSSVNGPGNGTNVDDYYAPEINSIVVPLSVKTPEGLNCSPIPDPSQTAAYVDSFQNIQCYDTLKVNAILNEIDGKTHNGKVSAPMPNILGMNFQAVSVGQKLIEANVGKGGYLDATGTPSDKLLGEIQFVDDSIGEMVSHLKKNGLLDSTLVVITAKHGQSPIDPNRFFPIPGHSHTNGKSPSTILTSFLPDSEVNQIGPTEDDISLLWLTDPSQTAAAVAELESQSPVTNNIAGIGQIFWGASLSQLFNPPSKDPRTPDIIVVPNAGVIYTGSLAKQEEHGGFGHDDTNVIMLLSNPKFRAKTITSPVETTQVAPTILKALGLDPDDLQAVRIEGTQVLPGIDFDNQLTVLTAKRGRSLGARVCFFSRQFDRPLCVCLRQSVARPSLCQTHAVQNRAKRFIVVAVGCLWRNTQKRQQPLRLHHRDQPVGFLSADRRIVAQIGGKSRLAVKLHRRRLAG